MEVARESQSGGGLVLKLYRQSGSGDVAPSETTSEDGICKKCPPGGCLEVPFSHHGNLPLEQLQECLEYDELLLTSPKPKPKAKPHYELVEYKLYTGMFNDACRRVDMVLVMLEYDKVNVQQIKADYLVNLNSLGLEIEIERGVMDKHKNLLFVKIHAPDNVLIDYIDAFDVKKLYKNKNFQYINTNTLFHRVFKYRYEMEWIEIVQKNYLATLKLSNHDRSYIVYMLLRYMSFGSFVNYVGLERLLDKNIILAAYALHDGPYFFTIKQDFTCVTARQILFYNWLGVQNILKLQPLHLIHEYFGPTVAFYFAFYEFYNLSLLPLAIAGVLKSIPAPAKGPEYCVTNFLCDIMRNKDYVTKGQVQEYETIRCSRCLDINACPMVWEGDECARRAMTDSWDNDYLFYFSLFVCVWALTFLTLWKRLEQYLIWIWELCHPARHRIIRPQHTIGRVVRSQRTGQLLDKENIITKLLQIVTGLILTLCGFSIFVVVAVLLYAKYRAIRNTEEYLTKRAEEMSNRLILSSYYVIWYRALTMCVVVTLVVLMCMEQIFKILSRYFTNLENHTTVASHQQSLVVKLFVFKALCTFVPVIFFAWLKGTFWRFPHLDWFPELTIHLFKQSTTIKLHFLKHFIHLNCNIGTCFDEVILTFGITILIKVILMRVWQLFSIIKTDYSASREILLTIPVWEREYLLSPVTEQTMMDKFCDLALQFALMTWFLPALPFAPALALFFNIWHLRYEARHMLLGSRRPMLFRSVGIGPWNGVLTFIAYTTGFAMALFIILQTKIVFRYSTKNVFDRYEHPPQVQYYDKDECPYFLSSCWYINTHVDSKAWLEDPMILKEIENTDYIKYFAAQAYCHVDVQEGTWRKKETSVLNFPDNRPEICASENYPVCRGERMQNIIFYNGLVILFFQFLVLVIILLLKYYVPPISEFIQERRQIESQLMRAYRYQFAELYTCASKRHPPKAVTTK